MNARAARAPAEGTRKRRDGEILEAAARIFHTHGYADASVQDVAEEVGILKGSLYHYIDSKEDLLFRLLEEVHTDVEAILAEVIAEDGLAPLERLSEYVRRQVDYNAHNLVKISVYYHDVDRLSDERRKVIVAKRRVHERFVAGLIGEAQESGAMSNRTDPRLLGNFVFATIIWMYRWYQPQGRVSPAELADMCATFVLQGLGAQVKRRRK